MTHPSPSIRVKQAVIVDLETHPEIPMIDTITELLVSDDTHVPPTRIALVLITNEGRPETLVLDVAWLDFAIELNSQDPEAVDGAMVPPSVIRGVIDSWPSQWRTEGAAQIDVTVGKAPGPWQMSIR